jgi:hypothetical protein
MLRLDPKSQEPAQALGCSADTDSKPGDALDVLRLWVEGELARSTHELSELLRSPIGQGTQDWLDTCLDTLEDIAAADTNLKILDRYI